jgi:hypothetical protein
MRLAFAILIGMSSAFAQPCVPARILPAGAASGALDSGSCLLPDGTPYNSYRLDLPARGKLRADSNAGLILRDSSGAAIASGPSIQRAVEAGSYTLLVNAPAPTAYSVRTAFTAEPGTLCTAFARVGLQQSISATLGVSGCILPDGTQYEAYLLNTLGAGALSVSVSSPDFTPTLTVRDSDGDAIASDAAHVSIPVDGDNQYQIVVATGGGSGAFQLSTSFQPAENETCRARKSFSDSGADTASITADSCTTADPQTFDVVYYNYYSLSVPTPGLADLTAASANFGATLTLLDESGNTLATSPDELRLQLMPGNYIAEVISTIPSGGAYTFAYQFTPGAPQPCTPVAANPGDALAGAFTASLCPDLYIFTLPASGTLDVTLTTTGVSGLLTIRDAKDNLVILDRDIEGLGITHLTADLAAGAYEVVPAASGSGGYQLTSAFTAHDIPACAYVQPLDINGGFVQKLGPNSCRGSNGQPVDLYQFTLPADGVAAAFMTSSEVDGYLTISDSSGAVLRTDDNSYGQGDPMIVQYLPAGTYQVAARSAGVSVGGYYQVDLRTVPGPRPPFCGPKGSLTLGGVVTGALTVAACQYSDNTFADLYRIDLPNEITIDLRLDSNDFDAYLLLLDAKGNLLDRDDDSGGDTNARITHPLPAGTYFAVAKSFSDYKLGRYTLSVFSIQPSVLSLPARQSHPSAKTLATDH